ncbi:MAG: VWA domain-containing protein, partial [Gammaproteobacteria bacterium]|nr:VWA domain-containing protein [Gammaproteobacteria bacterium]
MSGLETFHFMRPLWLIGLVVVCFIWWLVRRTDDAATKRYAHVAPHLQDALAVNRDARRGIRPADVTVVLLACLVVAAAGPAWVKQPSPWYAETAPLVIAMEVSDSMRSNDLQPTRLDRARFKVLDLVNQRTGSRTALIAYAGGAHVVMPPTKDLGVI